MRCRSCMRSCPPLERAGKRGIIRP
ncbi:hypothetical protein [Diaphorobacter limosus]